jgi:ABC-type transport system involved in multi-copper enzyme maturation permease subunit
MFSAIGLLVSSIIKRGRVSTFAGVGVVMLMYFYDALMKTTEHYDKLGYVTPYKFVPMDVAHPEYGFAGSELAYFLAITVVAVIIGLAVLRKKDIYV